MTAPDRHAGVRYIVTGVRAAGDHHTTHLAGNSYAAVERSVRMTKR